MDAPLACNVFFSPLQIKDLVPTMVIIGNGFTFTKVVCEPTHKLASDPLTEKVVDMVGETEILEFPATAFHE